MSTTRRRHADLAPTPGGKDGRPCCCPLYCSPRRRCTSSTAPADPCPSTRTPFRSASTAVPLAVSPTTKVTSNRAQSAKHTPEWKGSGGIRRENGPAPPNGPSPTTRAASIGLSYPILSSSLKGLSPFDFYRHNISPNRTIRPASTPTSEVLMPASVASTVYCRGPTTSTRSLQPYPRGVTSP